MQAESFEMNVNSRKEERLEHVSQLDHAYWSLDKDGLLAKVFAKNHECIITDISLSGLRIVSIENPDIGQHIIIPIKFQSFSPIKVRCRVRYSTFIPKGEFTKDLVIDGEPCPNMYTVGLALEGNDENIHEQIKSLCENLTK